MPAQRHGYCGPSLDGWLFLLKKRGYTKDGVLWAAYSTDIYSRDLAPDLGAGRAIASERNMPID